MPDWNYRLHFSSAFGIFSGLAVAGLVDRMVMRNQDKLPFVPGSTVKGRWRFSAERLLRGLSHERHDDALWIHAKELPACKKAQSACTICTWFGSPAVPGALQVGNADLEDTWRHTFEQLASLSSAVIKADTEIRPGVALSRKFRTALPDHLFFDEAVPPVSFAGRLRLLNVPNKQEAHFLRATAALVDRLGARKDVGRGHLDGGIRIGGVS